VAHEVNSRRVELWHTPVSPVFPSRHNLQPRLIHGIQCAVEPDGAE